MPISWNEIRQNAIRFSREWTEESREHAEAKSFWDDFFSVFGIRRRTVASFEAPVKTIRGTYGHIDLFWPGVLLVEHKSLGQSLDEAESQAFRYIQDLVSSGRESEVPRYVLLSDFARLLLFDLEYEDESEFGQRTWQTCVPLAEFHRHVHDFAFIPGYKQHRVVNQDPINIEAVGILGHLHDTLAEGGYTGPDLERFLVRVLFCLFAEDTGLFERDSFRLYLENHTKPDGSDLGPHLENLFELLNTPPARRQKNLGEELAAFPFVNGELFAGRLAFAQMNRDMRNALMACTRFDWSSISPAIFGSLFQAVMEPAERRQSGGHYTSEQDILKLIQPLFLDELRDELRRLRGNKPKLRQFHEKLGRLRFFDPACGCGNFLVVTYRELRLLEIEVLQALYGAQMEMDIHGLSLVDVDAFYGIEISEWPARIAEVALWLMDHQMNLHLSEAFGQYFVRLPLRKSACIVHGNALRMDWRNVLAPEHCDFLMGNPPFVGAKFQNDEQRRDMALVANGMKGAGLLDYVTAWYLKAADYMRGSGVRAAFVSTNSISQGEQVGVLWSELFQRGLTIHFAHRTFAWQSEARGKAHVHVVIIGFGFGETPIKRIYDHGGDKATVTQPANISPYLVEGPNTVIFSLPAPLCEVPEMGIGNKPIDGGNYLFTEEEKQEFLRLEPAAEPYFYRWVGADEFINGHVRWCLWLEECPQESLRRMPHVKKRVDAVGALRAASKSVPTQKIATTPTRFHVTNRPGEPFLVVPGVSSETRPYIPMGFLTPDVLVSNLVNIVPGATLYHFGVLTSAMHMAWMRQVGGRLKSDYRYSIKMVYNNFPWPYKPDSKKVARVEEAAQGILDTRDNYPNSTFADLYDPLFMPYPLHKAHVRLDRAVDRCYRSQSFNGDASRMTFLFNLYNQYTMGLLPEQKPGGRRRK
ncbi:MAG: class I SAM-dependent DNA methyltransferase [Candidatus Hydrogenedentes bacterium]|nr:class I SAM-dependent DNA methyltransferase [Candidatus Hydrogenedentota bacterium]